MGKDIESGMCGGEEGVDMVDCEDYEATAVPNRWHTPSAIRRASDAKEWSGPHNLTERGEAHVRAREEGVR